jgi:uncharacterized protein (TIGR02217 family)
MPTFIETPRFPESISYGSSGGPGFKTFIFEGHNGVEQRNITFSRSKGRWDVAYGVKDKDDMDELRAFFYQVRGRAIGFRFKDHSDYELVNENIGVGDGVENTFRLIKTYGSANPYIRRIFKPVSGTLSVTVNNVAVPLGAGPTQVNPDYTTGTLVFGASVIPASTHIVRASCEFDVPCRFDVDQMEAEHEGWLTETWSGIGIVEIVMQDTQS